MPSVTGLFAGGTFGIFAICARSRGIWAASWVRVAAESPLCGEASAAAIASVSAPTASTPCWAR